MQSLPVSRRRFVQGGSLLGIALASGVAPAFAQGNSAPSNRVRFAVVGLGRGMDHVNALLQIPGAVVAAVCDVDKRRTAAAAKTVTDKSGATPASVTDLRRLLDDREIDAISIATPNFWHAPAAILSMRAGKHVYVEKPGSHNAREGERMVEVARSTGRLIQMGTQRRSSPSVREAIQQLRENAIGPVRMARCRYDNARGTIGRGKPAPLPDWLDYNLWQGPVPERPYVDNLVHYNWHWRWHWGGGELANNGPHALDIARWGLGVEYPTRVAANGGRYHFQDDQETPDTLTAHYEFGTCGINWDGSSCHARKADGPAFVTFYGDLGTLAIDGGGGYRITDPNGKETKRVPGRTNDVLHFTNFIETIRGNAQLNAPIAEGVKSVHLCHLGNIAWRTTGAVDVDPKTGRLKSGLRQQRALWSREYRKGWNIV